MRCKPMAYSSSWRTSPIWRRLAPSTPRSSASTIAAEQPGFVQFAQPGGKGAWFALSESANARPFSDPEFWWYVNDADDACADLNERGVEIAEQPHDMPFGRVFSIHDPAGNTLYMLELR